MKGLGTYLDLLFGAEPAGAYVELRWRLRRGAGMGREFLEVRERERLAEFILARGVETDLYLGVAPRRTRQEGTRDAVQRSHALWTDCDTPEAMERLRRLEPAASMIIRSGSGLHGYWSLLPPAAPDELEAANRKLAAALGGDARTTDAARILRPPGTFNFKRPEAPAPVTVERVNVEVYTLEQVVGQLPDPPELRTVTTSRPRALPTGDDPLLCIPAAVYVEALTGQVVGSDAKVSCPFHEDRTPSLHVYPDDRGWACFGCGRGGTIIDLGAALFGIAPRGAGYHQIRERLEHELRGRVAA